MTGEQFKAWRKGLGLTQEQAADILKLSRKHLQIQERAPHVLINVEWACIGVFSEHVAGAKDLMYAAIDAGLPFPQHLRFGSSEKA